MSNEGYILERGLEDIRKGHILESDLVDIGE
jgi:hypothetical protein